MKRLLAYAQLVRLPNVFTALADIGLGALASGALVERWPMVGLLLLSSACLYCGGMVWNDVFDREEDRKERPFRPLPSGRVSLRAAIVVGVGLLTSGLACAALAGWWGPPLRDVSWEIAPVLAWDCFLRPGCTAGILTALILAYDGGLKRTPYGGPLTMAACRYLNIFLGWTVADVSISSVDERLKAALVIGTYILGVTCFARTEARTSNRMFLLGSAVIVFAGLLLALPMSWTRGDVSMRAALFLSLLAGYGLLLMIPIGRAIAMPSPQRVQAAVKIAVLGLIVLDAVLATALVGPAGLGLLVLLPPALFLGRWVYST
jgi:4-hydroxybenzoate polyprenyltransferase